MLKCFVAMFLLCLSFQIPSKAQSAEAEQLLLDVQKLAQLKSILKNLYKSYEILSTGYENIKSISSGSFNLHNDFLNALLEVSPQVKTYKPLVETIALQAKINRQIRFNIEKFANDPSLTLDESHFLNGMGNRLLSRSSNVLDMLLLVLSPGKLRMSDDERMLVADKMFAETQQHWAFLQQMTNAVYQLTAERRHSVNENELNRSINGIK